MMEFQQFAKYSTVLILWFRKRPHPASPMLERTILLFFGPKCSKNSNKIIAIGRI